MRLLRLLKSQGVLFQPSAPAQQALFHVRQHVRRTHDGKLAMVSDHEAHARTPRADHSTIEAAPHEVHNLSIRLRQEHPKATPGEMLAHVRHHLARAHVAAVHGASLEHFDERDDAGKLTARAQRLQGMAHLREGQVRGVRPEFLALHKGGGKFGGRVRAHVRRGPDGKITMVKEHERAQQHAPEGQIGHRPEYRAPTPATAPAWQWRPSQVKPPAKPTAKPQAPHQPPHQPPAKPQAPHQPPAKPQAPHQPPAKPQAPHKGPLTHALIHPDDTPTPDGATETDRSTTRAVARKLRKKHPTASTRELAHHVRRHLAIEHAQRTHKVRRSHFNERAGGKLTPRAKHLRDMAARHASTIHVPEHHLHNLNKGAALVMLAKADTTVKTHMRRTASGQLAMVHEHHRGVAGFNTSRGRVTVVQALGAHTTLSLNGGAPYHLPTASLQQHMEDMTQQIPAGHARAQDPTIQQLHNGVLLGKGNDGIAYRVGQHVVKISTTTPFQPENPGHRTPDEAVAHLKNEERAHAALSELPMVPAVHGETVEGRHYLVKPYLHPPGPLSHQDLAHVTNNLAQMHAAGWMLGDEIQLGREGHALRFMDLGQAQRVTPQGKARDMEHLDQLYRTHGASRLPKGPDLERAEKAARSLARTAPKDSAEYMTWHELATALAADLLIADRDEDWLALQDAMDAIAKR